MTDEIKNRNLTDAAHKLFGDVFNDITAGTDDLWWDLTANILGTQQGPSATFTFIVYTKPLHELGTQATIAMFDVVPSPLLVLDIGYVRELVQNSVRACRDRRSELLTNARPQ